MTTSGVLVHYDSTRPIKLDTDASQYGLGAVISHVMPDGTEQPIAFASRTLSSSEKNYSQIDKEALAIVYGIQKFHTYLYCRSFILVTDHKPLLSIFGPKKGVPAVAAARLQRWAILLSAYIQFRSTTAHGNADALSRLPLRDHCTQAPSKTHLCNIHQLESLPVTSEQVRAATHRDPVLARVLEHITKGWPASVPKDLSSFFSKCPVLMVESGCVLWGSRVVIPSSQRGKLLKELHREHMGASRMKTLARDHVWWPGIDKELEALAKSCVDCAAVKQAPVSTPLHSCVGTYPYRFC